MTSPIINSYPARLLFLVSRRRSNRRNHPGPRDTFPQLQPPPSQPLLQPMNSLKTSMISRLPASVPLRFAIIPFGLFLVFSMVARFALILTSLSEIGISLALPAAFGVGFLFDIAAGIFAAAPWLLLGAVLPDSFLKNKWARWLLAALAVFYTGLLVFITTAEWFFWDEFGARFNFIAVDYLIWTQEVWGNISESYPMAVIIPAIILVAALVVFGLKKRGTFDFTERVQTPVRHRAIAFAVLLLVPFLTFKLVSQSAIPAFTNQYDTEIAKNGCWSFFAACKQMELDYPRWYLTLSEEDALSTAKDLLVTEEATASSPSTTDLARTIASEESGEKRWNVILVCMESLSSEYMSYVKAEKHGSTPVLDRLRDQSVFFENLYATGTRTVRGMEALTLNLPPTPGQAIIYRPEGTNLKTTFSPFLDRGYDCGFFYGGDGRFDYMNRYFSTAGCRIMDANAWDKKDTTFKTSWGACDEDLFNKTLLEADKDHAAGKPFHFFCMTTSTHRPYNFPSGRIDLVPDGHSSPAVKYADWAIGDLIAKASQKPWFENTIFVIVSDHCARSAGKQDIDVTKYRIPGLIYNPGLVGKQKVTRLSSQIDVMPTVFGLMGWGYETLGYGQDLLAPSAASLPERSFVSNYQKIAMITPETMTILKPNGKHSSYNLYLPTGEITPMNHNKEDQSSFLHDTVAYYQSASWLFNSGKLKRGKPAAP